MQGNEREHRPAPEGRHGRGQEDVKKLADKHLPALRKSTRAVIDKELPRVKREIPKVAAAVREELPKVAAAVRKQLKNRRPARPTRGRQGLFRQQDVERAQLGGDLHWRRGPTFWLSA